MSIFVITKEVAVTLDGENIIYIRPRMGVEVKNRVLSAFAKLNSGPHADGAMDLDFAAYNMALLKENVLRWEGPEFQREKGKTVPCNSMMIGKLDPDHPLLAAVLEELGKRNPLFKADEEDEEEGEDGGPNGGSHPATDGGDAI